MDSPITIVEPIWVRVAYGNGLFYCALVEEHEQAGYAGWAFSSDGRCTVRGYHEDLARVQAKTEDLLAELISGTAANPEIPAAISGQ